ncbi:alpha-L-arabinofuranosidase [Reichenbachiella sp. 5M10]|uniref:alpha-L-arabinofuranosidase C-terminal domain-containing protein n=1 Tax=Reichenbachiella sp. 5M10 TaxID=1889772 RepID=UPI000C62BB1A|nr:alpha-L-arabinofuranosidase C-terminal domain-containing protein [Reichenbachiella sp. 5M10]PIB34693.1 alpha-L-arabinofuranosidase [Reichenbachiella sp. 5M10]
MNKILNHILGIGMGAVLAWGCSNATSEKPASQAQSADFWIDYQRTIAKVEPTMYGIFFEDINFAADGGIYAEMIKNRSFEFDTPMMGWTQPNSDRHSMNEASGFASVVNVGYDKKNSHFLRVEVNKSGAFELRNEGFRGMGIKKGETYDLTLEAAETSGDTKMRVQLIDSLGKVLGESVVDPNQKIWSNYEASIQATATEAKAKLNIIFEGTGLVDLDMVSLFPRDTWMGRSKGLRKDLVQLLADLEPGFLRFPGGCIVEGSELSKRYQWKKSVGPIDQREVLINRWNTEFAHRLAPDYFQSFGLGFFEYFQLSEDLGAEPLPILSCGIACQFNSGELVPMDQLDPYIEDALDLIEFANGGTDTEWGSLRAEMGHPEPFDMKYIGVGNEQWGPEYIKRYKVFDAAIKARYPEMIVVSGSGPFPEGEQFDYAMQELIEMNVEIIDEHFYNSPEWFLANAKRYDDYDRNGPKIFAGEYAAQSVAIASPDNKNNWECALSEAAFMTGLERNAEVVNLTSYAPLFAHADGWQWTPDMIWFNNLDAYGTANYYVQKLYANNPGTHVIPLQRDGEAVTGQDGLYASATRDEKAGGLIIKIVNTNNSAMQANFDVVGVELGDQVVVEVLATQDLEAVNSFDESDKISPRIVESKRKGKSLTVDLEALSLSIIKVGVKK